MEKINVDINELLHQPALVSRLGEFSAEPVGGSPEETAKYMHAEVERWQNVIKIAGVKLE